MSQNVTEDEIEERPCSDQNSPILTEYHITVPNLHPGEMQGAVHHERRLLDFLKATPSVQWLKSINICSPLENFQLLPSTEVRRHIHVHFIRRVDWSSTFTILKNLLKHPLNIALLLWLLCVAASGGMLILLMLGVLNKAFPSKSLRHQWTEIDNQLLNALFTLMSIYQHPDLIHHLVLLCRWRPEDVGKLRKVYCKNGGHRPNERAHMSVVVALLHVTCVAQYVMCGLYWGYPSRSRSEFTENFFIIVGVAAPVAAGAYTLYSPLGRDVGTGTGTGTASSEETKLACTVEVELPERRIAISNPVWAGELLDCSEDPTVCYLSFFCTFCVFGWNMELLGLGNMYVQTVMFLLLCVAPFWVFNITALNIHDYDLGDAVGTAGIVLCFFGLLYGGFWRIQMRKRLGLPANRWCCGSASLTDYVQWLFCWPCALAQEVRTGNLYDGSFYENPTDVDGVSETTAATGAAVSVGVDERIDSVGVVFTVDGEMMPPVQPVIESSDAEILANGSIQLKS